MESILLSIQSLLSTNPYENEPGFEDANEESDKKAQKDYVQKVPLDDSMLLDVISNPPTDSP